jgi:hypothetical protein
MHGSVDDNLHNSVMSQATIFFPETTEHPTPLECIDTVRVFENRIEKKQSKVIWQI